MDPSLPLQTQSFDNMISPTGSPLLVPRHTLIKFQLTTDDIIGVDRKQIHPLLVPRQCTEVLDCENQTHLHVFYCTYTSAFCSGFASPWLSHSSVNKPPTFAPQRIAFLEQHTAHSRSYHVCIAVSINISTRTSENMLPNRAFFLQQSLHFISCYRCAPSRWLRYLRNCCFNILEGTVNAKG